MTDRGDSPPSGAPAALPATSLAATWFGDLVDQLEKQAESYQTDLDIMDPEVLELFAEEIREAVAGLQLSVDQRDEQAVRRYAHTLQGMGGTAGAPEISVVGRELSDAAKQNDFERIATFTRALEGWEREWTTGEAAAPEEKSEGKSMPRLEGKLLVVDDERANRRFLSGLLEERGATVLLAESGEEALDLIRSQRPDVAMVDVMMPGMTGYEVCRRVKEDPETADTAVIMVTAKSTVEDIEHGFELGAFDYIRKPFHSRELIARVQNALQLKFQNDALRQWKERMSRELQVAGALQSGMFNPKPLLGMHYDLRLAYSPSQQIGGDLFDVLELQNGHLFAYVADVAGHGVASALVSTLLKGVISEVARNHISEPLYVLNNLIHTRFRRLIADPEIYATSFMIRVDPSSRRMDALNCGHPLPVLLDREGRVLPDLIPDCGGMPIGMLPPELGDPYTAEDEIHVRLPEGALLFIYTDGLIEARTSEGRECGMEGLIEAISALIPRQGAVHAPEDVLTRLRSQGYELSADDCSLVGLHLLGETDLVGGGKFPATAEGADRNAAEIERLLRKSGWDEESAAMVRLVAMEHTMNVVNHGGLPEHARCLYRLTASPSSCQLLFRDTGADWNAANRLRDSARRREDGSSECGRGLSMIHRLCNRVDYFRRDNRNHTFYVIEKSIGHALLSETPDAS